MNRLILDTDGGIDDAQALLLLIAAGRTPYAVTTVFGNVGLDAATANILATLAVAGIEVPVHMGARKAIAQPLIDAKHVHGEDGLGGAPRPARTAEPAGDDAVGFLVRTLREAGSEGRKVDLLMIGPLTNLALALDVDAAIAEGIGRLTIMGGTIHGRGNVTPAAEFNIYADPEAAKIVFSAGLDTVVVPWEPCVEHHLPGAEVDALFAGLPESPVKRFSLALANHARQRVAGFGGGDAFRFVDPFAAAVAVEPEIVTRSIRASVDVALAPDITRGMTVVDPSHRLGTPAITLVERADIRRLTELYAASMTFEAQQ
ncbi:nucleoside hydrolase [Pleomorphomonas sp. NRK KF1]|uniref:nucleoside hydrolase n=1 Tax=Pleomorphomonas sp. NRK KF1 TaxID=2943000 RepID=UPI0020439FA4|nr:nucleoside hydrolase [Pleomorphomonas sp. NRK KF1]MCM5552952.1 nucleoside hydrolase [Pleomorphomonas sp. NRK KF1]